MNRNCPRVGTFTMPFALCCWSRTGDGRIALTERRNGSDKNSADRHGIASGHEVGYDVEGDHDVGRREELDQMERVVIRKPS